MISREDFVQDGYAPSAQWLYVVSVADQLVAHLEAPLTSELLRNANQPGRSSALVQQTFEKEAESLGFRSERRGLFSAYQSALRPDYYLAVNDSGIILEVERGKTTINNMDLLDFWKCHICEHADYLFLMVPTELRQNPNMSPRREFATVSRRIQTFFRPENYTNVRGVVLIGY